MSLPLTGLEELPTDDKKSKRKSRSLHDYKFSRQVSSASVFGEIQYSTSSVITYVIPLSSVSKYILIDGMDTTSNIATLPLSYIPLESHYGQVFLALLASLLTLRRKLQLYENKDTLGNFVMPNGLFIDASGLVILSIAHDICKML